MRVRGRGPRGRRLAGALLVAGIAAGCASSGGPAHRPAEAAELRRLAETLLARGRPEAAAALIEPVARRDGDPALSHLLGAALLRSGRPDEALPWLEAALARAPERAGSHHDRGRALDALGRSAEAWASYRRALELAPGRAAAANDFGFSLLAAGRLDDARREFERALALDPHLREARSNLALAWILAGHPERGLSVLEATRPPALARSDLGALAELAGRRELARALYREALALDPSLGLASRNLARLGEEPR